MRLVCLLVSALLYVITPPAWSETPAPLPSSTVASGPATVTVSAATTAASGSESKQSSARTPSAAPGGASPSAFAASLDATSTPIRIIVGLTVLAVLPALLVCLTSFLRIIVVLSMLRHAIGMPETPPNMVLIGMALFMTMFTMAPVLEPINRDALQPFMEGRLSVAQVYEHGSQPLREFMIRQTREQDMALMVELSKAKRPESINDISNLQLIPAFMLSELRAAFQIGFVVFLPFLLIDLIVSSVLMALGMMMMPPITIALPLKVLMFVLVDGWSLILRALVGSFH